MNNIYKVIWSKAKNCYVVASEIARSHTKSATGSEKIGGVTRRSLLASLMALSLLCGGLGAASAANSTVHVDESASGAAEVYTKTGVDTLLGGKADKTAVEEIKNTVGGVDSGLVKKTDDNATRIEVNKTNISALKDAVGDDTKGLTKKINDNTAAVTTLEGRVGGVEGKVTALETTVGDASSGLVKDVADLRNQGNTLNTALGNKADQSDLDAANEKISANEGKITNLETKTGNLSTDGKSLTGMDAVSGTTVSGDTVNAGSLNVTGEISNGNGVTTTLEKINASMEKTNKNADKVADLEKKTSKIDYDAANDKTTINGVGISNTQVDMGGKDITNARALTATGKVTGDGVDAGTGAITGGSLTVTGKVTGNGVDAGAGDITTTGNVKGGTLETTGNATIGGALSATGKVTGNGVDAGTGDITGGSLTVTGKVTGNGVDAGAGDITTTGNVKGGTLETTGNATIGGALSATGKVTGNGVDAGTGDITGGSLTVTGKVTGNGVDAGAGDITTTGNVKGGTLETTGDATIGRNLDVKGTLNTKDVTAETIHISKSENNPDYKSEGSIIGEGGKLSVSNEKFDKRTNITEKSELNVNEKGTVNWATSTDATGNKTEGHSEVTADNIKNFVKKTEGGKTFGYEENITADGKVGTVTDKEGNTSSTRQDSKGIYGYAKDKDGNKSYTKQEGNRIAESVIGQDGKETKSEMTSTDITNTAKDGTITNTAKNVTNEGTESVTNKVGNNEVKVSQNGVDIKAEAGKKITESVGTASRVVENDKITDKAADSTVTTENGKGTTFGKEGSTGTTNIYGDSIKTGTINAKDTTTDKLTAGAAADADGGRLTVDARDGVKGSYKSGEYTSRSYILANTLKSGVDNGKEPTEDGFVGSRTDHYMDGNKAKLDETVKDADGSNVTNKTSTGTVTTITDGTTTTKTEQGVKDITNTATDGTIKNDAKVITNKASEVINNEAVNINNTATGIITSKASEIKNQADKLISNKVGENTWENMENGKITTSIKDGAKQNLTQSDAAGTTQSTVDGGKSTVTIQNADGLADAVTDGRNTSVQNQTASAIAADVKDGAGNENASVATATTSANTIKSGSKANTVISTADGTSFINSEAAAPVTGDSGAGTAVNTTIKGNTITTGKVTMDYAEVMKDLGVRGNANITGKTTTGSLEVTDTSTLKGDVTMGSNATVKKDFTVEGNTNLKNTKVDGTLDVTQKATFGDSVSIAKDLSVDGNATIKGDVTAKSYKVGDKTYISAAGINANDQKITNVADGSISEGSKDAVNGGQLYTVKNDLEGKVNKVGANAAAMANLHPMEFDPDSKWNIAAAIGNYGSETAAALGAFYRPNNDVMVNLSTAFGTGENMVGGGVSVRLGKGSNKLSREENNALKAQVADLTARMDALLSVLNPNMSKDFPDVPENHWAYEAVSRLAGNDIVQGYPDGEFHGERTMTRYEMAEIIYNALSRGAEAEKELVEEFKPELQAMAASEKATAEKAEG